MGALARELRRDLDTAVRQARRTGEDGARKALEQLAVGHHEPWPAMTPEQRMLRNRLRAHGRQLGDRRDPRTGAQAISRLATECAYEHWHRMLFARFLAENELLIEPGSGIAISLEDCRELAREQGRDWLDLASAYAVRMLPQIFRPGDPVLDIVLPPETRQELETLLKVLSPDVFQADDSLGWVYQYWQTDKKDAVNRSEVKIGADELPAVTQLFTEDYMVLFLLHNTLGAWWAGKVLAANPDLANLAKCEDDLRPACRVGDVEWTYLRFVRDINDDGDEGPWRPAAGTFDGWPKAAKDVTVLDPCMGSGHFLVFALPILAAFRMAEDGLSRQAAVEAVLRDNLFGLEIDQRCTQIAAFNLAFAAWRMVGYRPLPKLNIACSGLAIGVTKPEWLRLSEKAVTAADPAAHRDLLGIEKNLLTIGLEERVKNGLEALYDLFAMAPWLGSLIDPRSASADIFREGFDNLQPLLASVLSAAETDDAREMAVVAQGMAKAAESLSKCYTLQITNVPFLAAGKMVPGLREHTASRWREGKADLSTVMLLRMLALAHPRGTIAAVTPQNWYFLGSYRRLRELLLRKARLNITADLGPAAFHDMNWWAARTALTVLSDERPPERSVFVAIDAEAGRAPEFKAQHLREGELWVLNQADQCKNPDHRITLSSLRQECLLSTVADYGKGSTTGDRPRFLRYFWELKKISKRMSRWLDSPKPGQLWSGRELVLTHPLDCHELTSQLGCWLRGHEIWGRRGVALSKMRSLDAFLYDGEVFDDNVGIIAPHNDNDIGAIAAYVLSKEYQRDIRMIDKVLKVTAATLVKVPFDADKWDKVAAERFPIGLPEPYSEDLTQWLFHGHPGQTERGTALQVAVLRLVGYRWPAETDASMRIAPKGRDLAAKAAALETGCPSDPDGIACLIASKGKAPAHERLIALLADAFGAEWSAEKLASLLAEVGFAGKTIQDWLRDGFFENHCALFHQRPFVWHVWDGRRDGFHALVNYHRLAAPDGEGRRTLEKLIYSYLGDWIERQRAEQKAGIEGADARLAYAEHLRAELIKILEGEPPYDIFVRWKPLQKQPIGWDPDINDGVRMNIRPFMTGRTLNARGANACVLRSTPRIKWEKDRGKEPTRDKADYPWFWGASGTETGFAGGDSFDGNRWNDLHYSVAFKQAARQRKGGS